MLSPARWVLPTTVTEAADDRDGWNEALTAWRASTEIPSPPHIVVLEDGDRRLPLDLRRSDDRELLRRYVRRGVRAVTEQPGGADAVQAVVAGPTGHHVLELAVPLARNTTAIRPARPTDAGVRIPGMGRYLPGSEWLSLAVRSPTHCHDQLLSELDTVARDLTRYFDTWFWLRYHTAEHGPHVRARFRGDPATLGSRVLPALCAWCQEMIRQRLSGGFTVEPYDQEIERQGGPAAIGTAEDVFAADSSLALVILASVSNNDQRLIIAALSAAAIARSMTDAYRAALAADLLATPS